MSEGRKVKADYIVVTYPITNRAEAQYPSLLGLVKDGQRMALRGYRGLQGDRLFVGRTDDRIMVQATGARAEDILQRYDFRQFEEVSFARMDIQMTIVVTNADGIITLTHPNTTYQSTLVCNLNAPGATLYVGSASSRARMRMYNKSAEAGIKPDPQHDYLRIEFQLRDSYADRAAIYYYQNQLERMFRAYAARMTDPYVLDLVDRELQSKEAPVVIPEEEQGDWISRRLAWLEHTVKPAIEKLAIYKPESALEFLKSMMYALDDRSPLYGEENRS